MHTAKIAAAALILLAASGCTTAYQNAAEEVGVATITDTAGRTVGTVRLHSLAGEVTLSASFSGLPAGPHGVHLHAVGNCSASDFTSAGGHLNPGGAQHGTRNPQGAHLGDLPNVEIGADGSGSMSAILRGTGATLLPQIFDADGTAFVVHAGPDDYRTDPSGDSGSRIACGTFAQS
jgi:Cu-Zn family superoxide dismutase